MSRRATLEGAYRHQNDLTPQPDCSNPVEAAAVKTNFDIVLTDEIGGSARVHAGDFSDSALNVQFRPKPEKKLESDRMAGQELYTASNLIKLTLGGLRISLSAFVGVNLSPLATVRFDFGGKASPTGAIHLADVLFDKDGKEQRKP